MAAGPGPVTPVVGKPRRRDERTIAIQLLRIVPWLVSIAVYLVLLAVLAWAATDPRIGFDAATSAFLGFIGLWAVVQSTVGTVIVIQRPGNRLGLLMQLTGPLVLSVFVGFFMSAMSFVGLGVPANLGAVAGWWGSVAVVPALAFSLPFVGILFPDGDLPSRRWRLPVAAVAAALLGASIVQGLAIGPLSAGLPDNPFGLIEPPPGAMDIVGVVGTAGLVAAFLLAVASLAVRWRGGGASERAQTKWLLGSLSVGVLAFAFSFGIPDTDPTDVLSIAAAMLVPISIGIAVLRYRLYEIDRIISRTLGWAIVTGVLAVVFTVGVVGLQATLSGVTQGQTLAVAASTVLAFALFQPVRQRVQRIVDRRFDRARYDSDRTAAAFAERLRSEVDLGAVADDLTGSVDRALRPTSLALWLRGPVR
ncbi:MAG TPA: hypothetical protein VFO05_08035 [Candidatus Limnocylindrales bacterium]|nr:hypothetical protein [Candidatus Limnocylindrales bacterium]